MDHRLTGRAEARIVIEGAGPRPGHWGSILFGTLAGAGCFEYADLGGNLTGFAAYRVSGFGGIDAALVIEPGTTAVLGATGSDSGDFIRTETQGSIQAVGVADVPIVFDRAPGSPGWNGIGFDPLDTSTGNRFEHVHMANGGPGRFAGAFLRLGDALDHVADSRLDNSRGAAIACSEPGRLVLGPGNRFSHHAGGDLGLDCR